MGLARYKSSVDYSPFYKYIRQVLRRSTDWSGVFRAAMRDLEESHSKHFGTNGGGTWKPVYSSWKTEEYGAGGILVRTGTLKRSLTLRNARGAIRDIGAQRATFGTSVSYAHFHQTGTENMAKREVLFTPNRFSEGLAKDAVEYLAYGNNPLGAMKRAVNIGRR